MATLEELSSTNATAECYGLFTRAEEVGFAGAIEMARSGWLQAQGVTVISLETSAERPDARIGEGAIVRVGDKTSVFDPAVTAEIMASLPATDLSVQRRLMSGGSCEATAFRLYGVRCGAMCVALGNYHNLGPNGRIEPEFVSVADVEGLYTLCLRLAGLNATRLPNLDDALRAQIEKRLSPYQPYHHRDRLPA